MFPVKPDHLGVMSPIPAVETIPGSSGNTSANGTSASIGDLVEQRVGDFLADIKPQGAVATFLTRRAAMLSVRLERCVQHNSASVALRVRRAEGEFVANRQSEVDHLHSWINAEPATYSRRLRQSPEGIDRMINSWHGLRFEITDPDFARWGAEHRMLAESLTGRRSSDLPVSSIRIYSEAYFGFASSLVDGTPELAKLKPAQRQELAKTRLIEIIDAEIISLTKERAVIDLEALERDRVEAADRALFDPSPAATLARRYELATERGLLRTLRMIAELEISPEPEAEVDPGDLVEAAPDPTLMEPPIDRSVSKRSRLNVAFIKSAQRAADARANALDPARSIADDGRVRRKRL